MPSLTSQQLAKYYNAYRDIEIIFSTDVVQTLNLDPRQVFIKLSNSQWPCLINSLSMSQAKIIIGTKSGGFPQLQQEKGCVNLRISFSQFSGSPISFFISAKLTNIAPYANSEELVIITLAFTQRPPDDLIEILGQYSDANVNAVQKKDERATISAETIHKLGLAKSEAIIVLRGATQQCVICDLAFSGARVLLFDINGPFKDKNVLIRLEFDDIETPLDLPGVIINISLVEGKKNTAMAMIQYAPNMIPMTYKIRINNYLSRQHRTVQTAEQNVPWFSATDALSENTTPESEPA
ncbi:MAG: PilZ domain-containing protein [Treponema sp.]|jgi:hypothetical protein|nr:PilZ domain-containing protein [Treponema sp.]